MIKNIFLDFDGTIVDSGELIYRNLVEYARVPHPDPKALQKIPSDKVISTLKLAPTDVVKLIYIIRKDFKKNIHNLKVFPGVMEAIRKLRESGCRLFLCTSNSKANVETILGEEVGQKFESIVSMSTVFGKAKGIKKALKKHGLDPSDVIYVGDETRDIEAAKKCGIKSGSVTWGYNAEIILQEYKPDRIFKEPGELISLAQN